jgi:DNA-directed RNA polymerase specialized sigma24 family protein
MSSSSPEPGDTFAGNCESLAKPRYQNVTNRNGSEEGPEGFGAASGPSGPHEAPFDPDRETFAMPEANLVEKASNARARHEAIEELPPGRRDAIRMLELEERSLKEASTASRMSIAALKVATHRAMKNLR